MLKNETIYFPAVSAGTQLTSLMKDARHPVSDKSFRVYSKKEDPVYSYNHLLISAGHQYKKDTAKIIDFDTSKGREYILLGDSGGYQIATNVIKYDESVRDKIFHWLEDNTNYAMNLDIPPWDLKQKDREEFLARAKQSNENFKYFYDKQTGKTKFMNVLQGRTIEQLQTWYDHVKEFHFDGGWGIGGAGVNIFYLLQSVFFLYEKGELDKFKGMDSLLHILGFSKLKYMYIIIYLQHKLNLLDVDITLTYDSSTPFLQASYGRFAIFSKKEGISYITFSNKVVKERQFINLDHMLPCDCPVCKNVSTKKLFSYMREDGFLSDFYYILGYHNLYSFIQHKKKLENLVALQNKDFLSTIFSTKDMQLFNFIDQCFESASPTKFINQHKIYLGKLIDEELGESMTFF